MSDYDILPDIPIAEATESRSEFIVEELRFGNGFTQRLPMGTGGLIKVWQVRWEQLDATDLSTLDSFFTTHRGSLPFSWIAPNQSVAQPFICKRWQSRPLGAGYHNLTAQLVKHTHFQVVP